MEKVSIIIPCYNVAEYVGKCIQSIQQQTYRNIEMICINDGSTDNTLQILWNLQKQDSTIKVITQENMGLSASRNAGIKEATGEYIMFVDSDDWLEIDTLEKTFCAGYDLICFSYKRIFKNFTEPRILKFEGIFPAAVVQRRILGLTSKELNDPSQANSLVTAWAKIYKSSVIKKNGIKFTDTKIVGTEDALFNLQYLEHCYGSVKVIDKPYYNYLRHNVQSLTTTYKAKLVEQWKILHQKMWNIIEEKGHDFQKAYSSRIALSLIGLGLNEMERKDGVKKIYLSISRILREPEYIKSLQNLDFQYFPLHWRILFLLAKYRMTAGVFIMMKVMSVLWKRKNR